MTSDELAQAVEQFTLGCTKRILGVGHDQYDRDGTQRFESLPVGQLIDDTLEEVQDAVVYMVQLALRLERIRAMVDTL